MKKITFYDAEGRITGVMSGPLASIQATIEYLKEPFVEGEGSLDADYVRRNVDRSSCLPGKARRLGLVAAAESVPYHD